MKARISVSVLIVAAVVVGGWFVAKPRAASAPSASVPTFSTAEIGRQGHFYVDFETGKIQNGNCMLVPRNSVVGVDQRKPPLICIRPSGGFDCFWTISSAIDEFLTKPVAPKEPPKPKSDR